MSIKHPIHQTMQRGLTAIALVLGGIGLLPAAALAQQVIPPGHIIITRDVGPRNALTPEVGLRYTIATAPDPDELAFDGQVTAITDAQASQISGSVSVVSNIGSTLQGPLELLGGGDRIASEGSLGQTSGGFIGETVNGAISGSMSALSGVLSSLPLAP
jgi:hypothetical protein